MTTLAPHQRDAVERVLALLDRYGGAILADDVGLGKSFVAAAVARASGEHETELIVPAPLVAQWRETARAFGVEARLLTHDALAGDPFVSDPARRRLVIVDEAHAFRNRATQRWAALARRSTCARLLLVTATPLCNSLDDLASLVALIAADDALRDRGVHSIEEAFRGGDVRAIVDALVIRRGRDVLPPELQFGALARRVVRHAIPPLDTIDELEFPLVGGAADLLRRFLWRRLESSEAAFIESIDRQLRFYGRALDALRGGRTLTKRDYRRAFAADDERDAMQQVLFWDVFAPPETTSDAAAIEAEVARLARLHAEACATPSGKLRLFESLTFDEPALIFTGASATARAIHDALKTRIRCGLVTARGPRDALDAFVRGRVDVLIATDLASEGLNLQRAGIVVHYDIPWNPVKLDQRNGRAHRIGQTRDRVRAVYFIPEERTTGIVETIAAKNRMRRRMLGHSERSAESASFAALPQHLPRDCALAALQRRAELPPRLLRRWRAGAELLIAELSREFLDARRLAELAAVLDGERDITHI